MKTRIAALAFGAALLAAVASAGDGAAPAAPTAGKININQASPAQLALLPRIGARAAERIVDYRKQHGAFSRAEELMEVQGIGEKLFQVLKPYVALSGPTTVSEKVHLGTARSRTRSTTKSSPPPAPSGRGR